MISLQVTQHPYTAMVKLTAFKKAYLQLCFVRFCVSVFILEYSSGVFDLIGSFHENLKQRLLGPSLEYSHIISISNAYKAKTKTLNKSWHEKE